MVRRYFTTPIYYVNDQPHIGHLYSTVVTDVLARAYRLRGDEVRFLTGTDEHGQKMEKAAKLAGVSPLQLADRNSESFRELFRKFGIANDDFIRTTEPRHRRGIEELVRRIEAAGDLETARHEGWYCVGCEEFYPEKDLVDGNCPVHGYRPEWQGEENVFFRLDRYRDRLLDLYGSGPGFVFPPSRLNEVVSFVRGGLRPLSVSRTKIGWGIPFPGRSGHVVYVWLDALGNYITALGFGGTDSSLFQRFWPSPGDGARAVHVVGKDILRFHAVYWPAFLISAGLPPPTQIVAHGWWLKDERKMSKSVGNVVRPDALVEAFGVDPLRWFLLSEMSFGQDASFSDEAFLTTYNSDLANGLGNTLARATRMAADAFQGLTPAERCDDNEVLRAAAEAVSTWTSAFDGYRLQEAAGAVRSLLSRVDSYITAKEPWKRLRTDGVTPELHRIHHNILEGLRIAAVLLSPIAPKTAEEVLRRVGAGRAAGTLRRGDLAWGGLPLGAPLSPGPPLFPRADPKEYFASRGSGEERSRKETGVTDTTGPAKDSSKGEEGAQSAPSPSAPESAAQASPPAAGEGARISIDEFSRIDLRVGEIVAAQKVEKARKLMKMSVRLGEEVRTIVAGIATAYTAEQLVGKKVVIVANLNPAKLMGIESNGMVLAATLPDTGEASLLAVDASVPSGAKVR